MKVRKVKIKNLYVKIIQIKGIWYYKDYFCDCGCGGRILYKEYHKKHGIPEYIHGHNSKGKNNAMFGRTGKNHPNYENPMSEEQKEKIRNTLSGRTLSDEHIENLSKAQKKRLKDPENHPNWKGGISFLPYCKKFDEPLRRAVRKRDHYTCQRCGKRQRDLERRLHVHHVHFDKKNCEPDLISLCNRCNIIVNYRRKGSEKRFMKNLKERNLLNWTESGMKKELMEMIQ